MEVQINQFSNIEVKNLDLVETNLEKFYSISTNLGNLKVMFCVLKDNKWVDCDSFGESADLKSKDFFYKTIGKGKNRITLLLKKDCKDLDLLKLFV